MRLHDLVWLFKCIDSDCAVRVGQNCALRHSPPATLRERTSFPLLALLRGPRSRISVLKEPVSSGAERPL
jgi:hypothetical protein